MTDADLIRALIARGASNKEIAAAARVTEVYVRVVRQRTSANGQVKCRLATIRPASYWEDRLAKECRS